MKIWIQANINVMVMRTAARVLSSTESRQIKNNTSFLPKVLIHGIRLRLDQRTIVWEVGRCRFCFLLLLWPWAKVKVTETSTKLQKYQLIDYSHSRYGIIRYLSLRERPMKNFSFAVRPVIESSICFCLLNATIWQIVLKMYTNCD